MKYLAIIAILTMQCFAQINSNEKNPAKAIEISSKQENDASLATSIAETIAKAISEAFFDGLEKEFEENDTLREYFSTIEEFTQKNFPSYDNDTDTDTDTDEEPRTPTEAETAAILKTADEIYEKFKNNPGIVHENIKTAKEIIPTELFQAKLKSFIPKFLKLREDYFQKMLVICEKYPTLPNAQKIKSNINVLLSDDREMFTKLISLIAGLRLSSNNLYCENEIIANSIETHIKLSSIADICDCLEIDPDPAQLACLLKSKENFINICSRSNNALLKQLVCYLKKDTLEQFKNKYLYLAPTALVLDGSFFSEEIADLNDSLEDEMDDLLDSLNIKLLD